jgi:hypothetical protein
MKKIDNLQLPNIQLKGGDLEILDPSHVLSNCIIFFAFPKSKSANFPIALSLAQSATAYGEQDIGGRLLYWAGFTQSVNDLNNAAELMRIAGGWVGTMANINGNKVTKPFDAYLTISCYLKGLQCSNSDAHCHKIIDDPFNPKSQLDFEGKGSSRHGHMFRRAYIFPCKRMLENSMFHPVFRFQAFEHIKPQDQIQAAAVEYGVNICPFFDANTFAEIKSTKAKK